MQERLRIPKFEYEQILGYEFSIDPVVTALLAKKPQEQVAELAYDFAGVVIQLLTKYIYEFDAMDYKQKVLHEKKRAEAHFAVTKDVAHKKESEMSYLHNVYATSHPVQQAIFDRILKVMAATGLAEYKASGREVTPTQRKRYEAIETALTALRNLGTQFASTQMVYSDLCCHLKYRDTPKGHYSIAKDFFDDFKDVSLENALFSHLPQECCGVVKLPYPLVSVEDDYCFDEFLFFSGSRPAYYGDLADLTTTSEMPTYRQLSIAWKDRSPARTGFSFFSLAETTPNMTLEDAWRESWKPENNTNNINYRVGRGQKIASIKAIMINLLVYINSGRPDIRSHRNEIRYNSVTKEPRSNYKQLTEHDVKLVGYTWKKMPHYHADLWFSKPHFGWRRCGKNWSELTYTYIRGCLKTRKAGRENPDVLPLEGMNVADE